MDVSYLSDNQSFSEEIRDLPFTNALTKTFQKKNLYLKGNLKGYCSIRINDLYRIVFKFNEGIAEDVQIIDYHK